MGLQSKKLKTIPTPPFLPHCNAAFDFVINSSVLDFLPPFLWQIRVSSGSSPRMNELSGEVTGSYVPPAVGEKESEIH
ncbi:hypothetical protein TNIN_98141 [Trichonephila inaurata madagascariensis]|uniref:Uncharacterized protein n=1 Tax=Trichonephila inaurata madagascariensis TaxID=2747483 RepID=A0A8X6XPD5_9ARAC|nr:hypothetical protein TNIN_98141 [Trichonephila inaurata madagascariensis]